MFILIDCFEQQNNRNVSEFTRQRKRAACIGRPLFVFLHYGNLYFYNDNAQKD